METNVGEMPLEIYCDYVKDVVDIDWLLDYFVVLGNTQRQDEGYGDGFDYFNLSSGLMFGYQFILDDHLHACGNGHVDGDGFGEGYEDGYGRSYRYF